VTAHEHLQALYLPSQIHFPGILHVLSEKHNYANVPLMCVGVCVNNVRALIKTALKFLLPGINNKSVFSLIFIQIFFLFSAQS